MAFSSDISFQNLCFNQSNDKIGGREDLSALFSPLPADSAFSTPVPQTFTPDNAIAFFRFKVASTPNSSTAESRRKALNALLAFISKDTLSFSDFTETFLYEWTAWLLQNGYSQKTAAFYIKQIGTLYNQAVAEELASASDIINKVRQQLLNIPDTAFRPVDNRLFDNLLKFFRDRPTLRSTRRLAADIVAFAILNGGMNFDQILAYRKNTYRGDDETLSLIVEMNVRPRNRYLFPLNQSKCTPTQLRKELSSLFYLALSPYDIPLSPSETDTAFDLWCLAALRCDFAPARLLGLTKGRYPSFNPALSFITPEPVTAQESEDIYHSVRQTLTANPLNWYAMQFRPRVSYEQVIAAMKTCAAEVRFAELFYPSEEIRRRTRNRLRKESKPVVPGLLFFRCRATDITPMFRHIGHLAWCYRYTDNCTSSFAIIPPHEMLRYQTAIGQFTPDMEVLPAGTLNIRENDHVIMLTGSLIGRPATVTEVRTSPTGRTVFRLSFIGDNKVEWAVTADSRTVRPITLDHYA
ncbi:MAG: phage integrase SAM-like domain-containing protein, partial [Muribaculaceae bacterium]|nr:phage integrase SAM-like domain-containing protein [Muribaculaceae bacterium]